MAKQQQAKKLRANGLTYQQIGQQMNVSGTMARNYVLGISNRRPTTRENDPYICGKMRSGHRTICQRRTRHDGVHLANDEARRLVYWE